MYLKYILNNLIFMLKIYFRSEIIINKKKEFWYSEFWQDLLIFEKYKIKVNNKD